MTAIDIFAVVFLWLCIGGVWLAAFIQNGGLKEIAKYIVRFVDSRISKQRKGI